MDGGAWCTAVHGVAQSQTRLSDFTFTFHFHALEKEMATHSSVLAWRIPGVAEPGGLPPMGSHRVGHDWSDLASAATLYSYHNYICSDFCKNGLGYGNFCRQVLTLLWLKPIFKWILIHPNTLCISGFPDSVFWLLMYGMNFLLLLIESLCAVTFYWHFLLTCS